MHAVCWLLLLLLLLLSFSTFMMAGYDFTVSTP
jgi:hypothetical protein